MPVSANVSHKFGSKMHAPDKRSTHIWANAKVNFVFQIKSLEKLKTIARYISAGFETSISQIFDIPFALSLFTAPYELNVHMQTNLLV